MKTTGGAGDGEGTVNNGMSESEITLKEADKALEDLADPPWKLGETECASVSPKGLGFPSTRHCLIRSSRAVSLSFWLRTLAKGHSLSKAL